MDPSTSRRFALTLVFLCLSVPAMGAGAVEEDVRSACLAEVRQEMGRFQVKSLDPKMQHTVGEFCARGDLEGALRFAVPAAAAERCARRVREVGTAEPAVDKAVLSQAYQLCRRGELDAALALVGAGPEGGTTASEGAPNPPPRTDPPPPTGPPNIFRFQATPAVVRAGEPSRLLWDVYRSSAVHFEGEAVAARGERVVRPTRTTRYTLEAASTTESVEETLTVAVSPYPPATLGAAVERMEVCRELGSDEGDYRCIGSDGPFYTGDAVQVILRFKDLPAGKHALEYELFASSAMAPTRWTRIDHAQGSFQVGEGAPPRPGKGRRPRGSSVRDHRSSGTPVAPPAASSGAPPLRMAAGGAMQPSSDPVVANPKAPGKPSGERAPNRPGGAATAFTLADRGKGPRKLVVVLDGRPETRSELLYCVECPGHDEW
jgi:hypothetical protein